ncbi:MAG: hypothetical protein HKK67_02610 [Chlorobiaceae bacterium]|nr:hypothetical protein [Chlorobiaceae bacterium]
MMTQHEFVDAIISVAQSKGYLVENSRNGKQIDFGHKKLHEGHLIKLYPSILATGANISSLIESVAPGRPCSHKPMREIVATVNKLNSTMLSRKSLK